jgi:hypothetical protein
MRSSKADGPLAALELAFDPNAVLFHDPALLLDPGFVAGLHREAARSDDGEPRADDRAPACTLLQMGFLIGLHDAMRAVDDAFAGPSEGGEPVIGPPLSIRFRTEPANLACAAGLSLTGEWPERTEASAHLGVSGRAERPVCWLSAGYTSGWLSGVLDADILALETDCGACADTACRFEAKEVDAWGTEARAEHWLAALPFAQLRRFVESRLDRGSAASNAPEASDAFDPEAAAVHIWGPVMIIPFLGGDEALAAIDLIGRDPAAREVSVVAIDLSGHVLDEAFGAVALEQVIDTIEAWGAEAVLTGLSELSTRVIADLERAPLFVYKDLPEAITAAFRIADSQRRPV